MADALAQSYRGIRGSHDEHRLTTRWSAKPKPEVATAAPPPIAIKGRALAQVTDYDGLWLAMRGRVSELQITMLELDGLSEACDGYSAKILGPSQSKSLGKKIFGANASWDRNFPCARGKHPRDRKNQGNCQEAPAAGSARETSGGPKCRSLSPSP
jgi:hypothetical protein